MPAPPVIINNTPLVALWSLERLDLLGDLFGTVWLPTAVAAEFLAVHPVARQRALAEADWLQITPLSDSRHALTYTPGWIEAKRKCWRWRLNIAPGWSS